MLIYRRDHTLYLRELPYFIAKLFINHAPIGNNHGSIKNFLIISIVQTGKLMR